MNTTNQTIEKDPSKISVKVKLSALWAALMFLYIYADIISLYRPGQVEELISGRMGPFPVTQISLFTASILMIIPAVMVFLSVILKAKMDRWVNILLGALYTIVNIGNLIGVTWIFYISFCVMELSITLLIIVMAWTWRNPVDESLI